MSRAGELLAAIRKRDEASVARIVGEDPSVLTAHPSGPRIG